MTKDTGEWSLLGRRAQRAFGGEQQEISGPSSAGVSSREPNQGADSSSGEEASLQTRPAGAGRNEAETVIAADVRIKGSLQFSTAARIEGSVEGELDAAALLVVGESGTVHGPVRARRLQVFGRLEGDAQCAERIEVFSGGRLRGNISSPSVVLHDGALFEGYCRMEDEGERGAAAGRQPALTLANQSPKDAT